MPLFLVSSRRDGEAVPNRGPFLMALMWPLTGLALIFVVLRILFRSQAGRFSFADIFMIFSMVLSPVYGGDSHIAA